jgi:hypothetical protein
MANPFIPIPTRNPMRPPQAAMPAQPGLGGLMGGIGAGLNSMTSPEMLPWLAMAFGPTNEMQFRGMTGAIDSNAQRTQEQKQFDARMAQDQSQFDAGHALDVAGAGQDRKLFDMKVAEYQKGLAEQAEAAEREIAFDSLLSGKIVDAGGRPKYTPQQVKFMRSDPTGRKVLERDMEAAGLTEDDLGGRRPANIGSVPSGHELVKGEDGSLSLRRIPGYEPLSPPAGRGKAALTPAAAAEKEAVRRATDVYQADIVTDKLVSAALKVEESPFWTTGIVGQIARNVGGSRALDVDKELETAKAQIGFANLQRMREESPTGAALGQVTEKENQYLQSLEGSLDLAQSKEQLMANMENLYNETMRIIHLGMDSPPGDMSWTRFAPSFKEALAGQRGAEGGAADLKGLQPGQTLRAPNGALITAE